MNSFLDFFIASNTGRPAADTLIAAAFFVVLALTVMATFVDAVLDHRGKGRFALCTLLVAGLGGGFIRGILWHWAWWSHRWTEASLFGDIIVGTLIFFVKGAVIGAGAGFFLRVILALPQAFLLNLLFPRADTGEIPSAHIPEATMLPDSKPAISKMDSLSSVVDG